ncbi:nitroreductase [Streptococcus oralis]|uniref:Oxygen-insensitive NAD(P)H nitroreductase n=1 Tax=Streptococcus oralis TaxID=1303 RepID=A0A139NYC5_STROR|nr:nitroreductase [Streptococcus oralis]KXT81019.1 Oxygen-insensitive NAD(P)H nitroreductase [Streptococcus oralis]
MNQSTVFHERISIRDFQAKEVATALLRQIVAEAQQAPSWANSQPWKVYVATGATMEAIRKEHLEKSQEGVKGTADLPVKPIQDWGDLPWSNMEKWLEEVKTDPDMETFAKANAQLWNAPVMAYITVPKTTPVWSIYDAGAFAQTLMLSASSNGLDSMVAYENIKYPDEVRRHLPVGEDEIIVAGIALGYRSDHKINNFKSTRIGLDKILTIQ